MKAQNEDDSVTVTLTLSRKAYEKARELVAKKTRAAASSANMLACSTRKNSSASSSKPTRKRFGRWS